MQRTFPTNNYLLPFLRTYVLEILSHNYGDCKSCKLTVILKDNVYAKNWLTFNLCKKKYLLHFDMMWLLIHKMKRRKKNHLIFVELLISYIYNELCKRGNLVGIVQPCVFNINSIQKCSDVSKIVFFSVRNSNFRPGLRYIPK